MKIIITKAKCLKKKKKTVQARNKIIDWYRMNNYSFIVTIRTNQDTKIMKVFFYKTNPTIHE